MSGTETIMTTPTNGTPLVSDRRQPYSYRRRPRWVGNLPERETIASPSCRWSRFRHQYRYVYSARAQHFALHCHWKLCSAQKGGSKVRRKTQTCPLYDVCPNHLQMILRQITHPSTHANEDGFIHSGRYQLT